MSLLSYLHIPSELCLKIDIFAKSIVDLTTELVIFKDLEPGNDVNNMIEANRDAAEKVEQNVKVELSPQLSPEPITSAIESEINEIPSVVDEIKSSMEDMTSKITGAPQIVKTDVQAA